jgi:glycosyltransferase involved in cell wall biosynthesis
MLPSVSVITICLNDPHGARRTIESVRQQDYKSLEYVVVDGGSDPDTLAVYASHADAIDILISEPDRGIYDAMNKGLRSAHGEWYIMMNSGDVFASESAVRENMSIIAASEAKWGGGGSRIHFQDGTTKLYFSGVADRVFHQQSVFVRRALHEVYGYFHVNLASMAWDYFFFHLIREEPFRSTGLVVSDCDGTGVSSSVRNYLHTQVIAYLFGRQGRIKTAIALLLYPLYRRSVFLRWLFRHYGQGT